MYLCRLEIPKSEVRIPLKSNDLLFFNIWYNLEKVLLSIQMYCLLILINVCLFFCQLADFIVSNKNVIRWESRAQIQTEIYVIQKPSLFETSCRKPNKLQLYNVGRSQTNWFRQAADNSASIIPRSLTVLTRNANSLRTVSSISTWKSSSQWADSFGRNSDVMQSVARPCETKTRRTQETCHGGSWKWFR